MSKRDKVRIMTSAIINRLNEFPVCKVCEQMVQPGQEYISMPNPRCGRTTYRHKECAEKVNKI